MLLHLTPFMLTTVLYFYVMPSTPSLLTVIFKCLPIFCLAGAVHFSRSQTKKSNFENLIIYGLLCSSIGDLCLVYKDLFPLGMIAFAIAHCFYITAFGFKPLKPAFGLILLVIGIIVLYHILPNIKDKIIFYGIPVYCLFLITMSWRALARASDGPDAWSWAKILCALGSVLFVISDTIICFHDLQKPIPYGKEIIMSTYYAAQFGLALSIKSYTKGTAYSKKKSK